VLAAVVFAGGLVAALLIWSLDRFGEDSSETAALEQKAAATEERQTFSAPQTPAPETETPPAQPAPPAEPPKPDVTRSLPGETESPAATATIRLVTSPPGAYVVVDGRSDQSCMSPCSLTLSRGRHSLAATKEGYRRSLRIIEAGQDEEIFVNLDQTSGTVVIRSEPRGAQIYVDGRLRAEQTPAVLTLPTGQHSIEVVRNGVRETRQVDVRESVITNISVDFENRGAGL
jgi:hypothetical protein